MLEARNGRDNDMKVLSREITIMKENLLIFSMESGLLGTSRHLMETINMLKEDTYTLSIGLHHEIELSDEP